MSDLPKGYPLDEMCAYVEALAGNGWAVKEKRHAFLVALDKSAFKKGGDCSAQSERTRSGLPMQRVQSSSAEIETGLPVAREASTAPATERTCEEILLDVINLGRIDSVNVMTRNALAAHRSEVTALRAEIARLEAEVAELKARIERAKSYLGDTGAANHVFRILEGRE